jgi:hypothetical protein
MNSIRCSKCALVNFTSTEVCKRCGEPLNAQAGNETYAQPEHFETQQTQSSYETVQGAYGYTNQQNYYGAAQGYANVKKSRGAGATLLAVICLVALVGIPWYLKSRGGANEFASLSWTEFKSEDGAFSVQMPGVPKKNSMMLPAPTGTVNVNMYHVETGGQTAFVVGVIDYQSAAPNVPVDKLYDRAIESLTTRSQMTVLNRKVVTLNGRQGIEIEVKPPASANKDGDKGVFRLYWVSPKVYMIGVGGPDSQEAAAARTKFLDSFKILNSF